MIELWKGLTIDRKDFKSIGIEYQTCGFVVIVHNQQGESYSRVVDSSSNATRVYNKIRREIERFDKDVIRKKAHYKAQQENHYKQNPNWIYD